MDTQSNSARRERSLNNPLQTLAVAYESTEPASLNPDLAAPASEPEAAPSKNRGRRQGMDAIWNKLDL